MRRITWLAGTSVLALALPTTVAAQIATGTSQGDAQGAQTTRAGTPGDPQTSTRAPADAGASDIIVTARQREESLKDIPIAVTAISGDAIKQQQLTTVKDIAAYTPGLIINSDSVGRAFVTIRGVGTTFIDTVQPGVGIFVDGIYQPNTTYLNSPLVDVARVEVLRGPQGTLFGNNTLGGAINIISRQPTNDWEGRIDGALATGENFGSFSASVSGPIINDLLKIRVGGAYHTQEGFQRNTLIGGPTNPLRTKSVSATVVFTPATWAKFTANGGYDNVFGGSTPYLYSNGPRDYALDGATNAPNYATVQYYAANIKGEFDVTPLKTRITAIAAYNQSDTVSSADADLGPLDFFRSTNDRYLKTRTGEVRLDTKWSDTFSTLLGAFISRSTTDQATSVTVVPLAVTIPSTGQTENKNYAFFGTGFLSIAPTLDFSAGVRFDHQNLTARTSKALAAYKANQLQPRFTLTKRWTPDFMTYASVARGTRGGGQNEPNAPNVLFKGDSVWTYEVGAKTSALDRRLSVDVAAFYNDYRDFIGPNALAPAAGGGFVGINLNAGNVRSYGAEVEASYRVSDALRFYGNATYLHARVTDAREFIATTGYAYPGNRLPFVPDVNFTVGGNAKLPLVDGQALVLDTNYVFKGKRDGDSLDIASIPRLDSYGLINASLTWQSRFLEVGVFATNLNDAKYQESYLDASLLGRAGLPAPLVHNLAIQGSRRRVGLRGTVRF